MSSNVNIDIQSSLDSYTAGLVDSCGNDLVGIYLYGSLARGCYHPSTSDVDVIVVLRNGHAALDDSPILQAHRSSGVPVDAVFVTENQLRGDVFPTPVVCLVKPIADYQIVRKAEGSRDFLLARQDAYEAGLVLTGPPSHDLIRPVPWPLLVASLDYLFPHILPHFKNPVLMLSRIVYAWTHHRLCSKRDAGEWAVAALGTQWAQLIETALVDYASALRTSVTSEVLRAFEDHCAGLIAELR